MPDAVPFALPDAPPVALALPDAITAEREDDTLLDAYAGPVSSPGFAFVVPQPAPLDDDLLPAPAVEYESWADFVVCVRAAQLRMTRLLVDDLTAVVFSLYEPTSSSLVWDRYDRFMLGQIVLDKVNEHGEAALALLTRGGPGPWHRRLLARITESLQLITRVYVNSIRAYTFYVPHGRTPSISVHHLKKILIDEIEHYLPDLRALPVSDVALATTFVPDLLVRNFTSVDPTEPPVPRPQWDRVLLAFLAGRHPRLGAASPVGWLNDDCVEALARFLPPPRAARTDIHAWLLAGTALQWSPVAWQTPA